MNRVLTGNVWQQAKKYSDKATRRVLAVAYVTSDLNVSWKKGDILVCDASDNSIAKGQTDAKLLEKAYAIGVEIWSLQGLHSKVGTFDNIGLIGSANLSTSSEEILTELALLTDDKQIVTQLTALIYRITDSSIRVDVRFLDRISLIKVVRISPQIIQLRSPISSSPRLWMISSKSSKSDSEQRRLRLQTKEQARSREAALGGSDQSRTFTFSTRRSVVRNAGADGDQLILIHRRKNGTYVGPIGTIRSRTDTGDHSYLGIVLRDGKNAMSWAGFAKKAQKLGLEYAHDKHFNGEVSERDADLLRQLWH